MKRILIMGGTGFIGTAVARSFKQQGYQVTIQGRNPQKCAKMREEGFNVLETDHTHTDEIKRACAEQDVVVNCAGHTEHLAPRKDYWPANVDVVKTLIDACTESNKKLIHLSSGSVYCTYKNQHAVTENHATPASVCDYTDSKIEADDLITKAGKQGLCFTIFRPHLVIGPEDEKIVGKMIKMNAEKGIDLLNNGQTKIDLTDIDNLIAAIKVAVDTDKANNKIFNVSNDTPERILDVLTELFKLIELPLHAKPTSISFWLAGPIMSCLEAAYKTIQFFGGKIDDIFLTRYTVGVFANDFYLDNTAAKTTLDYQPISTQQSLEKYAAWYKQNKSVTLFGSSTNKHQEQSSYVPTERSLLAPT